jgi:hypothetical protein
MSSISVTISALEDPNGVLNGYEYIAIAADYPALARQRFSATAVQIIGDVVIFMIFTHLFIRALVILRARKHSLPCWCLFFQMASGFIYGCLAVPAYLPFGLGCFQIACLASFFISISSMMATAYLLCQAYYANQCDTRIKYFGAPLVLAGSITWVVVFFDSHSENTNDKACVLRYPTYLPLLRGLADISVNTILSVAFIRIIHQQYVKFGSSCWYKLRNDGIQYSLWVIASNLICAISTTTNILGEASQMIFLADCKLRFFSKSSTLIWYVLLGVIVAALLVRQHERMRKAGREMFSDRVQDGLKK